MKIEDSFTRAHRGKRMRPRISPTMIPPPPTRRKSRPASQMENAPVTTAATAIL
jgi:hypothetical protein